MLIRMVAVEVLTVAGLVVIEAAHAEEALAALETQAADVHVLFTDIHMPGSMNGLELAHHTRHHWPWIALLISSGRVRPELIEMPPGSRFLAKPYDPNHMLTHIRELAVSGSE